MRIVFCNVGGSIPDMGDGFFSLRNALICSGTGSASSFSLGRDCYVRVKAAGA